MLEFALWLIGLGFILLAAELFTNSVEWLGKRFNLSEGLVGSLLAAVGTALPETLVPIVAFLGSSTEAAEEIGIGAIIGAPFMLATLALFITGVAAFTGRRDQGTMIRVNMGIFRRDLLFFIFLYVVAITAGFLPPVIDKTPVVLFLVGGYLLYFIKTLTNGGETVGGNLTKLYFSPWVSTPGIFLILLQFFSSLAVMVWAADLFVDQLQSLAGVLGIPALVLSLVITPVATELPEKFNSVLWIRQGKDTLALGNITGAMVFQASLIPAIGMLLTPWFLDSITFLSALLSLVSGMRLLWLAHRNGRITAIDLLGTVVFYLIFLGFVLA